MSAFDRMKKMKDEIEARGLEEADTYKQKLAAARAEVAFKQSVIEEDNRGITNLRAELRTAQAEIAALRRVLAGVVERCGSGTGGYVGLDVQYLKEIRAALSAPSASAPLLIDIRAAVGVLAAELSVREALGEEQDKIRSALAGLRRWVP